MKFQIVLAELFLRYLN